MTSGNRSWFRIYLRNKHLYKLDRFDLGICCSKLGCDLFRRHFLSIKKGAIRHLDPGSAQTELQGMQTPFELKIMFLGVMTERTVTNFKKFRSASANSASLL